MPIGKEPERTPNQSDPKAEAWLDLATDPATDPQDFLTENPEDVEEFLASEDVEEGEPEQSSEGNNRQ